MRLAPELTTDVAVDVLLMGSAARHDASILSGSGCCTLVVRLRVSVSLELLAGDLHAPPKSEERVLRISSEFMRRAGTAAHALVFGRAAHDRPRPRPTEKGRANS